MWICTKHGFYSIVDKAQQPGCLMVRARRPGDIERIFPDANVIETVGVDYLYRAEIKREDVAKVFADMLMEYDAFNFKDSVKDRELHDAYMKVWRVMADVQPIPPYSRSRR